MRNKSGIPRLYFPNDLALVVAVIILIPLLAILYGVLFVSAVTVPRLFGNTRSFFKKWSAK
ncbi:MAG TPA: hypothetical protein VFT90_15990 [Chryseosolibacter sp.]|nr:hypothetical protein [Chryseosolibacter sp.]